MRPPCKGPLTPPGYYTATRSRRPLQALLDASHDTTSPRTMNTTYALTELAAAEASLHRMRCYLNSMAAAGARMDRQIESCRRVAEIGRAHV